MLKIRLQGTVKDIRWFKRLLESHPEIRVLSVIIPGDQPMRRSAFSAWKSPFSKCRT